MNCHRCKGTGIDPKSHYRYTSGGYDDRRCPSCNGDCTVEQSNEVDKGNANAVKHLALLGIDVCNRLKEALNQAPWQPDHPEEWIANARRNFERLVGTALRAEK